MDNDKRRYTNLPKRASSRHTSQVHRPCSFVNAAPVPGPSASSLFVRRDAPATNVWHLIKVLKRPQKISNRRTEGSRSIVSVIFPLPSYVDIVRAPGVSYSTTTRTSSGPQVRICIVGRPEEQINETFPSKNDCYDAHEKREKHTWGWKTPGVAPLVWPFAPQRQPSLLPSGPPRCRFCHRLLVQDASAAGAAYGLRTEGQRPTHCSHSCCQPAANTKHLCASAITSAEFWGSETANAKHGGQYLILSSCKTV